MSVLLAIVIPKLEMRNVNSFFFVWPTKERGDNIIRSTDTKREVFFAMFATNVYTRFFEEIIQCFPQKISNTFNFCQKEVEVMLTYYIVWG
jgi:hypothetical protein